VPVKDEESSPLLRLEIIVLLVYNYCITDTVDNETVYLFLFFKLSLFVLYFLKKLQIRLILINCFLAAKLKTFIVKTIKTI